MVHGSTCMYDSRIGEGICQYCWKLRIQIPFSLCYIYVNVTLYYNKNYTCSDLFNLQKLKTSFFMRVKINVKWKKKMVYIVQFVWSLQWCSCLYVQVTRYKGLTYNLAEVWFCLKNCVMYCFPSIVSVYTRPTNTSV